MMHCHHIRFWLPMFFVSVFSANTMAEFKLSLESIETPLQPTQISLPVNASEGQRRDNEQWVKFGEELWLHNVSQPSLTMFAPAGNNANGSAVIILPGGGFKFLAMNNEGWPIAEKLAAQGMTAFVLKYRLIPSPSDPEAFAEDLVQHFANPLHRTNDRVYELPRVVTAKTDAQAALRYLRSNAAQLHISPDRIGILGFSAGAIAATAVALDNAEDARPGFVGSIYGSLRSVDVPENPQPLFMAIASDDSMANDDGFGLIRDWHNAGGSTEFHWYSAGGHGFASKQQGTTSDLWLEQFIAWLRAQKFLPEQ